MITFIKFYFASERIKLQTWIVSKRRYFVGRFALIIIDLFRDEDPVFTDLLLIDSYLLHIADKLIVSPARTYTYTFSQSHLPSRARKCSRARLMHPLDSDARIRKYLNLIAGHDRYIAAVISVLITQVHRAVARLSGVMSVLRVAKSPCEMRKVETCEIVCGAEEGDLSLLPRINIRYKTFALICARILRNNR